MIEIRKATADDAESIWQILKEVIATGDAFVHSPDSSREKMLGYWCGVDRHTYVALVEGEVVGSFWLKDNQPDGGSHIANAGYMTLPRASGNGVGKKMGEFSLEEARRLGYSAMQFNIVFKSNTRAVALWQKLGFAIIGEIPDAFRDQRDQFINAYIMYRKL
jgi:ribosomal protein S18 acetylase RimI-like enzyme